MVVRSNSNNPYQFGKIQKKSFADFLSPVRRILRLRRVKTNALAFDIIFLQAKFGLRAISIVNLKS